MGNDVLLLKAAVMTDLYVPYCQNKTKSEDLLAGHRSYLTVSQSKWMGFIFFVESFKFIWNRCTSVFTAYQTYSANN